MKSLRKNKISLHLCCCILIINNVIVNNVILLHLRCRRQVIQSEILLTTILYAKKLEIRAAAHAVMMTTTKLTTHINYKQKREPTQLRIESDSNISREYETAAAVETTSNDPVNMAAYVLAVPVRPLIFARGRGCKIAHQTSIATFGCVSEITIDTFLDYNLDGMVRTQEG